MEAGLQRASARLALIILMTTLSPVPVDAALFSTTPALSLADSGQPTAILSADFNEDGHDDILVAHYETGKLTTLLNQGDGNLTMLSAIDAGGQPVAALAAKVDDDQHIDVLIAELESDNLWLIRGHGDGTFEPPMGPIVVGHDPLAISGGDFNEDGHFDLAVALSPEGTTALVVLLGAGDGTFEPPVLTQTLLDFGVAVAVGDFNNDHHLDVVGSYSQTSLALILGHGDGSFEPFRELDTGARTTVVQVTDLDSDGAEDLVLSLSGSDTAGVLRGRGDGTFAAIQSYAAGLAPAYSAIADINGDGASDAIFHSVLSHDVTVLLNDGHAGFRPPRTFAAVGEVQVIAAARIDADDVPDIVAATTRQGSPGLALFLGRRDGTLAAGENLLGGSAQGAVVADANGDAWPDLIVALPGERRVATFLARPEGGFGALLRSEPLAFPATRPASADFNEDGIPDLTVVSAATRTAAFLFGRGDGTFQFGAALSVDAGGSFAGNLAADVTGDGHIDAVLAQTSGAIAIFRGHGDGSFDDAVVTTVAGATGLVANGDFNGDHHLDLALVNTAQSRIDVLLGDGAGSFTNGPSFGAGRQIPQILASDFDLDGFDDLAFADSLNRQIRVALNDGNGQFPATSITRTNELPMSFDSRDVTGDSRPDLLVATQSDGLVTAFVNEGTFSFQESAGVGLRPQVTLSADFNADGRYDVATLNALGAVATVVTSIDGTLVSRGDGNGDGRRSAGDVVALARELGDGWAQRVDVSGRGFATTVGTDANGDGYITRQDLSALLRRLFGPL